MNPKRLQEITSRYRALKVAVVGDLCLDRYFEIDSRLQEVSIETGLAVHNVSNVRCQPGAAGTIINNLAALGLGEIYPVAIIGEDGEGFELKRALSKMPGVINDLLVETSHRRTFTYSKPLILESGKAPVELNRLDIKNWTHTPEVLQGKIIEAVQILAPKVDAMILLDQVDMADTGVITRRVLDAIRQITEKFPNLLIIADSRRGLSNYPKVCLKMNAAELAVLTGAKEALSLDQIEDKTVGLSEQCGRAVFVSMAEKGIVAGHKGELFHVPALPLRGEIDIVGAGDAVMANLASALAAGAGIKEAMQLAMLAASIVIHQLGTTGTAGVKQLGEMLLASPFVDVI
ncbi:MAG: bifunctional heptose 7-phosphate kinase/heptose 1-phosphate adenyltransferase [Verrucomicrobiales bacterium]